MFDFDIFATKVSRHIKEGKSILRKSQLLTEVVNSKRNRDYFYQKFCQLTIDLKDLYSTDDFIAISDKSEQELLRKEGVYIISQLEQKKIYVSVDTLGSIHNMMLQAGLTAFFKQIRHQFYASGFADFTNKVEALAKNKYATSNISAEVLKFLSYYNNYSRWYVSEYKGTKVTVQLARVFANALFILVMGLFNKRRAVLPKKDIFNYATNLYDLVDMLNRDLSTRQSQREIKRGGSSMVDIKTCTVYRDSNVLVIEPKRLIKSSGDKEGLRKSAEMCHKYFGIYRTSLVTGQTVPGANWCTAVGPDLVSASQPGSMHFLNRYLFHSGNNLYYFVDLREDKIYALRTSGSDPEKVAKVERLNKEFDDPARVFRRIMMVCTEEATSAMGSSLGSAVNLLQKFGLSDTWAEQYIKFVTNYREDNYSAKDREEEANLVDDPEDLWAPDQE